MLVLNLPLFSLDFSILNKGDIIFQEIYIDSGSEQNNYYHNFGVQGLEPGARHNINIYSTEDILFCSFYLYGISQESYIIENVAIEQKSVVYILPEHYREFPDAYPDLTDPDAVYGARPIERDRVFSEPPDLLNEDSLEPKNLVDIEVFNYTNYPVFRIFLDKNDDSGETNLLSREVLKPSESLTLHLPLEEEQEYKLKLKSGDGKTFIKALELPMDADFLVFYDSDSVSQFSSVLIELQNDSAEELIEVFLIDQVNAKKKELLNGIIMAPQETREILIQENYSLCDIMAKTAGMKKIYLLDQNILENKKITITDF
ncbi:hypothetical protein EXM22_05535 [Oceanispirochaeta crateris]|uniref:Uncharacterized protein n=1 Tax=Oceanispirochaeta crateris TaxID=2518645 RepID=A0A5C1QJJ1_9SPIO|nr:hypothetical protein [Oceanispirochaeta crateris]QEN07478.1 hypothetical protein EXM22_05535 [Oceanispirochaeta crateris]